MVFFYNTINRGINDPLCGLRIIPVKDNSSSKHKNQNYIKKKENKGEKNKAKNKDKKQTNKKY